MTIQQKLIRNKLGLLELTSYLKNVSEACWAMGYIRDTFCRVKNAYAVGGLEALHRYGSVSLAARALGIDPTSLIRKLRCKR